MPIVRRRGAPTRLAVAATLCCLCVSAQGNEAQRVTITGAPDSAMQRSADAGSRLALPALQTPAAVETATQLELQDRGLATLADAGRGFTGVTSAWRAGAPGVFASRGFVENGLAVLFDGIRVGGATLTMRNAEAFSYDRVEVARGPASALFGEGAGAGAINFVRRKPRSGALQIDGLVQAGSAAQLRTAVAAMGTVAPGTDIVLSAVSSRQDGPADAQSTRLTQGVAGVQWQPRPGLRWFAELDWLDSRVDNAYWGTPLVGGAPAPALARRNYNLADDNLYDDRVLWLRAGVQAQTLLGRYDGQVYRYDADRDWKNLYAFSSTNVTGRIQPRAVENLAYDHGLWGTRHELSFTTAASRSVVGVEFQDTELNSPRSTSGNRPDFDPAAPLPVSFDAFALPRADARRADVRSQALFGENRLVLAADWALVTGARWNRLRADIARPNANVAFAQNFSYGDLRAGLTWAFAPARMAYLQAATGSEPMESIFIYDPSQRPFDLTRFRLVELGTKGQAGVRGEFEWSAALYRLERSDIPAADPVTPGAFVQIGRQSSRGAEVTVAWRAAPTLTLDANAATVRARFDSDVNFVGGAGAIAAGNRPANVPKTVFNLGARWQFAPAFTAGLAVQQVGERAGNSANTVSLPGYTLIDLWWRWAFAPAQDLTLRVKNAGDTLPAVWASSGFGQVNVVYGDPRRVELAWRGRF